MARSRVDVSATDYDKASIRRQPVLFPPPRDPRSPKDTGLLPRYGLGMDSGFLPKFQTAEAMEEAIETYFTYCEDNDRPPTMAGLALALGFRSVRTLKDYEKRGEGFDTIISVARTVIEEWLSIALIRAEKSPNGIIFALKNMHEWADKIEQTTIHQAGNTLAELLTALQGSVLRPAAIEAPDHAIEAEFVEVAVEAVKVEPASRFPEIPDEFKDLL